MIPWQVIGRALVPGGGAMVLCRRGDEYVIRVDGIALMSSRAHRSEERLAELGCEGLGSEGLGRDSPGGRVRSAPRVLIGGLGLGYTLRAALDRLPPRAEVVVAELVPEVVEWNRGPLGPLAGQPLDDRRVRVAVGDVAAALDGGPWDAVLLDVDNSADGVSFAGQPSLCGAAGLQRIRAALGRPHGRLAVWAAGADPAFVRRLERAGFAAEVHRCRARGEGKGSKHVIFVGRLRPSRPGRPGRRRRR